MFDFKTIMNNIKNLEWKKYFYKNLLICSLVIFFVFSVITIALTSGYSRAVDNELNRYCMEVSYNVKDRVNKILDIMSDSYSEFLGTYNDDVRVAAYSEDITTKNGRDSVTVIKKAMNTYASDPGYVDSIYFYFPKSQYIISNSTYFSGGFRNKAHDTQWIEEYERNGKTVSIRTVKIRGVSKSYFTVIKPLNVGGDNLVAYNIDVEGFFDSTNEDLREFYIVDDNNSIIYGTDTNLIGAKLENMGKKGEKIRESLANSSKGVKSSNNVIFVSEKVSDGTYSIVMGIDSIQHDKQIGRIRAMMIFIILLVAFVTVVLAFFIVSEFYNNILDLVLVIDGKERKNKRSFREIKFVKNKIMTMLDKNSKIENELANRIELVSKTKMETLQSQLNSHFLYNTLGLISAIDILENKCDTKTVKAIAGLSDILRFALSKESYTAPLSQELIYMKKYLDIQRLRYNDKFDYYEEIDESLLDINIIKMIIQPLMENAVFHGIAPSTKRCKLMLKIYKDGDILKIQVSDDGVGMTQDKVKSLREEFLKGVISDVQTHGLLSVNQRCMLFYGPEYGCEVECENGVTTVTVKHPILQKRED